MRGAAMAAAPTGRPRTLCRRGRPQLAGLAYDRSSNLEGGADWLGSFLVQGGDGLMENLIERFGVTEGLVGQVMPLQIGPTALDVVQFGSVFGPPFEGEPGTLAQGLGGQPAGVDRTVIKHQDHGLGAPARAWRVVAL